MTQVTADICPRQRGTSGGRGRRMGLRNIKEKCQVLWQVFIGILLAEKTRNCRRLKMFPPC